MNAFATVLDEIFASIVTDEVRDAYAPLAVEEERTLIARAKLGEESATIALMRAYTPALRAAIRQFGAMGGAWAGQVADPDVVEDLRAAATLGFLEAIKSFDGTRWSRLAAIVPDHLRQALSSAVPSPIAFSIPQRTLTRFYAILRKADGNPYEAAALAPQYEMRTETFLAVLSALRDVDSYDAVISGNAGGFDGTTTERFATEQGRDVLAYPLWDGKHPDAEDEVLVEAAFSVVDTLEKDVIRMAYGFTEYDPIPDAEIGARLILSRQKVQRTRSSGLGKMRVALGVA
jgi:DNA-directed RNA polymerase specialized sigma subunit